MAFGFFRRRQKMVVIIMAVLMVTFLIGFQGFQMIFSRTPSDRVVGHVGDEEITMGALDSALRKMERLRLDVHLGAIPMAPQHEAFNMVRRNGPVNMRLAYCLLLHEAVEAGIEVSQEEINGFLVSIGLVDEFYANRIAEIREKGMTEDQFRGLIAGWLTIYKVYAASAVQTAPSLAETRRLCRDLAEQINLRVVRVSAEDLLKDVPGDVSDKEIQGRYRQYASKLPGRVASTESFDFGYLEPHRVRVGYLLIDTESIARAARPSDADIEDYWIKHEDEFTKEVPAAPKGAASKPATRPTTKPTSAPTTRPTSAPTTRPAMKTVKMSLSEATTEIIEILGLDVVRKRLESMNDSVEDVRAALAKGGETGGMEAYREIRKQMTQSADRVLRKKLTTRFVAKPLDEAVAVLAKDAGLEGICYPWGEQGTYSLDPKVKVSLDASSGMTLAVALDRITAQAFAQPEGEAPGAPSGDKDAKDTGEEDKDKSKAGEDKGEAKKPPAVPTLRWALCKGLGRMLFCHGGEVDMFPIKVGQTGLLNQVELSRHAVLRGATTARRGGAPLAVLAFMAKEFGATGRSIASEVGKDGKKVYVGRSPVIWRLLQAVKAHPPAPLGADPAIYPAGLRDLVARDVRLSKAFDLAAARARQIEAKAKTDGLEAVAKAEKLETSETGLFSRKRMIPLQAMIAKMITQDLRRFRIEGVDVPGLEPYVYPWNHVAAVNLPRRNLVAQMPALQAFESQLPIPGYLNIMLGAYSTNMHGEQFMREAFRLMPDDLETRGAGKVPKVAVFLLPARMEVYVMERMDHVPLVASDIQGFTAYVADQLMVNRRWKGMMKWFALESIVARTGYEQAKVED